MVRVFEIECEVSTQLPLRVLGLFAQRDVLPVRIAITRYDGFCRMRLEESSLDDIQAAVITEKLRSMVLVTRVDMFTRKYEMSPSARSVIACASD